MPHLPKLPNSTSSKQALDIGAGSGRDTAWLAAEGWNVVAVEPALGLIVLGVILPVGRLCVGWMILYLSWLLLLIIVDFIGNHHSFFNKPEALFKIGPTNANKKDFINDANDGSLVLPEGCFINYDPVAIDFM